MKDHAEFLALIFIIIIIVFGGNYFLSKEKSNTPSESANNNVQQEEEIELPPSNENLNNQNDDIKDNDEEDEIVEEIPSPSERGGVIDITSVHRIYSGQFFRISLNANLQEGETLNITDWKIRTNKNWFLIPEAVNKYEISGSNKEGPVILESGHRVYIYVGYESPVNKNFRLNNCLGYLNDQADFRYSLSNNCPSPDKEDYKHLSGECQNIIRSLNSCELPDPNEMNSLRFSDSNECREFIYGFFNVRNCYQYYEKQDSLLKNDWWLWVNRYNVLDYQHDWIRIENTKGKVIDEYSY